MPPLTLEGETLGEKRRNFNKLVADAVASKHYELTPISDTDSDINNLLKIEIACKNRNVDYVIEVMKSKDMLYASTAIKKSTWLITDPQYANIINPEYLHTQLKPYMTTKAFNKLMLHIRLNLKDESRVETFYEYFKETENACKWLQNCSIPFIENVIQNERLVPKWLFERLCNRSDNFLAYNNRVQIYPYERGNLVLFMLKSHTEEVLNIFEGEEVSRAPDLGKKRTKFLLRKCPDRIFNNFKKYSTSLDNSMLVKHVKKSEIEAFLYQNATELAFYYEDKKFMEFIRKMDEKERIEFIRKAFIDRTEMIFEEENIKHKLCVNESDYKDIVNILENMFTLLKDWKKALSDYPVVHEQIQKLIQIKEEMNWTTDLAHLYNMNKSWRKYLFEVSLSLSLCEETCLNALKHKPQLLTRHDNQIHTLRTNDAVSLRRVLAKLRVYWPDSLARHWTEAYMQSLNEPTGQKAVIKGLFVLLAANEVVKLSKKYVPNDFDINWGDTDQIDIIMRKNIANHLHIVRPFVPLDTVLWFAKVMEFLDEDFVAYKLLSQAVSKFDTSWHGNQYLPSLACFILCGRNEENQVQRFRKIISVVIMTRLTLEGDTLGKKRQLFNNLVADAVASKHYGLTPINYTDSDLDNLLKIEIACKNKNVDYVIEVMKSKDMLYASTAIKKSTWLITDPQYANIINPEYLHTQLKPYMTTKAFNKLMLHIRLNLKDESRVETFYEYLKETDDACKWLQHCSIPFIENVIKNERRVPVSVFKRLCKRSAHFLSYQSRAESRFRSVQEHVLFMLKSHTEDVIKIFEEDKYHYMPSLNRKRTKIIMKKYPQKVFDEFDKYYGSLDLSEFAKYLPKNEIKTFLCKATQYMFTQIETWRYFLNNMEKDDRFEFVKKTLIDKTEFDIITDQSIRKFLEETNTYQWYEFLPFDVAFSELKNLIRKQNLPADRCSILTILISSARKNPDYIKALLKYYYEKHINEPYKYKIQFVNALLSNVSTHEYDVETWNYLNQLFHSMEVYVESNNDVRHCLEAIILYNVIHDEPVPEIVEQKQSFNTFRNKRNALNEEQQNKLFTYILNSTWSKIKPENITNESQLDINLRELGNVMLLLNDWNKTITDYPFVLEKIQELTKIKDENNWNTNLTNLYNVNKSWRKYMFEEALSLSLCEETCLNALKHKPQLLTRHDKQIHTLRTNDAVSLRRVLAKLRVYWPDTLAQHWTEAYMQSLNEPTGQKSIIEGVILLSPIDQVIQLGKKYIPASFKINWSDANQTEINIQKNIAKHLHIARPLVSLDAVLWYAKGDFLQNVTAMNRQP
ncbi:unnamed protein product [Spodoptera exigua]|nr:unnamed protein product [Spodoptera exigua]